MQASCQSIDPILYQQVRGGWLPIKESGVGCWGYVSLSLCVSVPVALGMSNESFD
jgi:hypothetical protein